MGKMTNKSKYQQKQSLGITFEQAMKKMVKVANATVKARAKKK